MEFGKWRRIERWPRSWPPLWPPSSKSPPRKRSAEQKGIDYRGRVTFSSDRLSARNVTLQHLIAAAYHVQHLSQVR